MTDEGLAWQRGALTGGNLVLQTYNLGAAARQSAWLGRELTSDEMEGFRVDQRTAVTARKKLVFDGEHYTFA